MADRISDQFRKLNTNGVQNGNITKFRIIASGLIGLLTIGGGIFLLYSGVEVPTMFWYLAVAAVGGVVGVDVLVSIFNKGKK
ncbi:MAG: hypothetical protein KAJ73_01020 [Zetaproteobacteria bacterium]|nr:hypothetical protein [Zetaproteobacteria bacterium]